MNDCKTEIRDGMHVSWDVPVPASDGLVLRADVYRPIAEGRYPAILGYGPYGKWLHFGDGYREQWSRMVREHPHILSGSTNKYQSFEYCDPEKFVPDGYALVRVDSRGTGRSPGFLDPLSARETRDVYECVEWTAAQPWCTGKVGMSGISYLASNQWQVAELEPPHLAAMCIWEGCADYYRELIRHGGILSTFGKHWFPSFILPCQHGLGARGYRSSMTGDWVCGPRTLTDEELSANRYDWFERILARELVTDEFWTSRTPDFSKIRIPLLSAGNWGGQALHLRGNVEGFLEVASEQKWLEFHCLEHWTEFYTDYGIDLQKRFFGYFLKGENNGWDRQPRVQMQIRRPDLPSTIRHEHEWPLARTQWIKLYLQPGKLELAAKPPATDGSVKYAGFSAGVTFLTPPLEHETEITGPIAAKLFVSSSTEDADLFVVVRVFTPDLAEVTFQGHTDPHTTIAQGWLRASHRKLDLTKSLAYRPCYTHDEVQKLTPHQVYELDIEVWPTCIVVPPGHRIAVTIRGKDYVYPGGVSGPGVAMLGTFTGVGPFRHNEGRDRPAEVFNGDVTLHCGPDRPAYVMLPIVPAK